MIGAGGVASFCWRLVVGRPGQNMLWNVSGKLRALLLYLHMHFPCFGPTGLVCMKDQPSRLCSQPQQIDRACLHKGSTTLVRWAKIRSVSCYLLVCRAVSHGEVVHMNKTGILGTCTVG